MSDEWQGIKKRKKNLENKEGLKRKRKFKNKIKRYTVGNRERK